MDNHFSYMESVKAGFLDMVSGGVGVQQAGSGCVGSHI